MLGRTFEPERDVLTREWRTLHNYELYLSACGIYVGTEMHTKFGYNTRSSFQETTPET